MKKYNIPIFVPHKGCPFDCVFCNQNRITGSIKEVTPDDVTSTIEAYLSTLPKHDRNIEVAFFGGSFTGIPIKEQSLLMERVTPYIEKGIIDGIMMRKDEPQTHEIRTNTHECVKDTHDKTENSSEIPNNSEERSSE